MITIHAHCPICQAEVIATRQPDGVYLMRLLDGSEHPWQACKDAQAAKRRAA